MSLNRFVYKVFATLLANIILFLFFISQKYDAMRCIPLIGLYNTPYYDVESVGGVFYF